MIGGRPVPVLVLAAAVALAGCGAEEEAGPQAGLRAVAGEPAPEAAAVLERFVGAAGRGDAGAMWELLSKPTRASLGPTLQRFRAGTADELRVGVGELAGSARPVLAHALDGDWAVAAVAGETERDGELRPAAFGAALRREEPGWRLELDGVFFVGHRPGSRLSADEPQPALGAVAQSSARVERIALWLDGIPVGARATREQPFTARIGARLREPLRPGVRVVTVFAATGETAGAFAWPVEVEE